MRGPLQEQLCAVMLMCEPMPPILVFDLKQGHCEIPMLPDGIRA